MFIHIVHTFSSYILSRHFVQTFCSLYIYDEKGTFFTWLAHKQSQVGAVQQEVRSSRAPAPSTMSLS